MIINKNFEYKENEYIHFVREYTGEVRTIQTKKGERKNREYVMREIPFKDFLSVNLNTSGETIPFSSSGVINVNRYLFTYWTYIMGADVIMVYILLTEYVDDETEILFPKEKELAERLGISLPTLRTKLEVLEDNNFIMSVNRLNLLANKKETSLLIKIRQTVPLISQEQYNSLPEYLKLKHDKFMERYGSEKQLDYFLYDSNQNKEQLLENSEKLLSKKDKEKIQNILEQSKIQDYILANLSSDQKLVIGTFHEELKIEWKNSPSLQLYFIDAITVLNSNNTVDLICDMYTKDMIQNNPAYPSRLNKVLDKTYECQIDGFEVFTFEEYIYEMERLK